MLLIIEENEEGGTSWASVSTECGSIRNRERTAVEKRRVIFSNSMAWEIIPFISMNA
jgi:hypothetical protein